MNDSEFELFRVEHITRGEGLVVDVQEWRKGCDLYVVEFDSGEQATIFSTSCTRLESDVIE